MLSEYELYRILSSINMLLFVINFLVFMNKKGFYKDSKCRIKNLLVYLIISIVIIFIGFPFGMVRIQILSIIVFALILLCKFIYNLNIKNSIIDSFIYSLIYVVIESTIYWFILIFLGYRVYVVCLLDFIISSTIIFVGVCFYEKLNDFYIKNKYRMYILFAIMTNIFILLFLNSFSNKIYDFYQILIKNNIKYDKILTTINLSGFVESVFPYILVIINIIFIIAITNYVKSEKENSEIQIVNEKLKMQYKYYLDMEENQDKMKQVYHDMNNHIKNIKSMKDNNIDIDNYIDSIENEVKNNKNIYNTGNGLLDIILYEKSKECLKNNISFNTFIDFTKCEFIEMIDISSIFSNLLDNAIESCIKISNIEKRYIILRTTKVNGYFVIRCENSKNKNINSNKDNKGKFITSKDDKFYHGIGIKSIKSSIYKYDGDIRIKEDLEKFVVNIYIPF